MSTWKNIINNTQSRDHCGWLAYQHGKTIIIIIIIITQIHTHTSWIHLHIDMENFYIQWSRDWLYNQHRKKCFSMSIIRSVTWPREYVRTTYIAIVFAAKHIHCYVDRSNIHCDFVYEKHTLRLSLLQKTYTAILIGQIYTAILCTKHMLCDFDYVNHTLVFW